VNDLSWPTRTGRAVIVAPSISSTSTPGVPAVGALASLSSSVTVDERNRVASTVRFGERAIYADGPFLPAERIRTARVEYIRTGELPETVMWQRRTALSARAVLGAESSPRRTCPHSLTGPGPNKLKRGQSIRSGFGEFQGVHLARADIAVGW
jgi:hypothetical protein